MLQLDRVTIEFVKLSLYMFNEFKAGSCLQLCSSVQTYDYEISTFSQYLVKILTFRKQADIPLFETVFNP